MNKNPPKIVFIVPYRNREEQAFFFKKQMSFILEDTNNYEIYFSHQCDNRTFNRGGTRNIGFLAIKEKYPEHYKSITFVFNDVDTLPYNKVLNYDTTIGIVKHFYGFEFALGGIISIKGSDFEKINGYPCYWGWGMEDNVLQKRCNNHGLIIDRSNFYKIGSPEILQLFDGVSRIISKQDPWRMHVDNGVDGLNKISNLTYTIDKDSVPPQKKLNQCLFSNVYYINVNTFNTFLPYDNDIYYSYDLREPKRRITNPLSQLNLATNKVNQTKDWSNIPHYPTTLEQLEKIVSDLRSKSKPIPNKLIEQINKLKNNNKNSDPYNKNIPNKNDNINPVIINNNKSKNINMTNVNPVNTMRFNPYLYKNNGRLKHLRK